MTQDLSQDELRRRLAFYNQPRSVKIARAPLLMLSSGARLAYCRALRRVVPTRVKTFWGQPMLVMLPERGSIALMNYGFLEAGLTSMLMRLIKPGMTFFDVGAHYGYFSLLASRLVGPDGTVHAFEPSPHTFSVLRQNTAHAGNVRLNPMALFSHTAELTLQDFGVEFSEFNTLTVGRLDEETQRQRRLEPRQITVQADSVDHYVQTTGMAPNFVKIDAEGAELLILSGMASVMAQVRPLISLEVAEDPVEADGPTRQNLRFMEQRGYIPYECENAELRQHVPRSRYIYENLLFVHHDSARVL